MTVTKNAPVRERQLYGQVGSSSRDVEKAEHSLPERDSTTQRGARQEQNARCATNGDDFQRLKDAVTMPQVAEMYGYTPNRAGKILCPFHSEKTPSCKIYENRWYCFGACKEGGDAVKFVEKLFSLSPMDALKKLNTDFSVGLTLDRHKATPEELAEARRRQEARDVRRKFDDWRERAIWSLTRAAGIGEAALQDGPPWTDAQVEAIKWRDYWDYLSDLLSGNDESEQLAILRDWPNVGARLKTVLTVEEVCA